MPLSDGTRAKNSFRALIPPAEAPMPTTRNSSPVRRLNGSAAPAELGLGAARFLEVLFFMNTKTGSDCGRLEIKTRSLCLIFSTLAVQKVVRRWSEREV